MKILIVLIVIAMAPEVQSITTKDLTILERQMLEQLCPEVDICISNATSANLTPNGMIKWGLVSCCQGCSCHPDCGEKLNCCFPDKDGSNNNDNRVINHDCLNTHIVSPGQTFPSTVRAYRTITRVPPSGCVDIEPLRIGPKTVLNPTCSDEYFPALKGYFPVYSPESDQIFKNMLCARCHGIKDIRPFSPLIICQFKPNGLPMSFSEQLSVFDNGILSPKCYIEFVYRNPKIISTHKCYNSIIDTCESNVTNAPYGEIFDTIDIEMVRSLCESGISSPVSHNGKVYRNSFCLLCGMKPVQNLLCLDDSIERTGDFVFVNFLEPSAVVKHLSTVQETKRYPEVCVTNESSKKVTEKCRRLYCSSGKIRDHRGDCVFVTNMWRDGTALVHLRLIPIDSGRDTRKVIQDANDEDIYKALIEGQPWPDKWSFLTVMKRKDKSTCAEKAELDLFITLQPEDLKSLYLDIKSSINQHWSISLNGSSYTYTQTFHEYRGDSLGIHNEWHPFWTSHHLNLTDSHPYFGCDSVVWKQIFTESRFRVRPVYINKLIVCSQVRLAPNEFELDPLGLFLKSNLTRRILYENEYDIVEIDGDMRHVSVCLADTIFSLKTGNAGSRFLSAKSIVMTFLALITLFRSIYNF